MAKIELTLAGIRTGDVTEHPLDPWNSDVELYQTWQLKLVDPLDPADVATPRHWLRQGASHAGGAYGMSLGDGAQVDDLEDPTLTYDLDQALEGKTRLSILWVVHWWNHETKEDTLAVKSLFSDEAAATLLAAWRQTGRDGVHAAVGGAADLAAGVAAVSGVGAVPMAAIKAVSTAVELHARTLGDDYWSAHTLAVDLRTSGAALRWSARMGSEVTEEQGVPGVVQLSPLVVDPFNGSVVRATYRVRLLA